ncbi:MazF family toxin-antitoxin system protein [Bacillus phage SWEP1]|nr:MazF family toxin-antitoxin system protein [Bacillus phage SWEP1]
MSLINKGDYIIGGIGAVGVLAGIISISNDYTVLGVSLTTMGGVLLGFVGGVNLAAKTYHRLVEKGEL